MPRARAPVPAGEQLRGALAGRLHPTFSSLLCTSSGALPALLLCSRRPGGSGGGVPARPCSCKPTRGPGRSESWGSCPGCSAPRGCGGRPRGTPGVGGGGRDGHAGHGFGATPRKRGVHRQRAWDSAGGVGKQVPIPVSSGSGPKRRLPMVN